MTIQLLKNRKCQGCAAIGYVEKKTQYCCYCFGLALAIADRKRKLDGTIRQRFAKTALSVKLKLDEFHAIGSRA